MNYKLRQIGGTSVLVCCFSTLLLSFASIVAAQSSHFAGQAGRIAGTVVVEANHRPADGVIVNIGLLSGDVFQSVLTDSFGRFDVSGLPGGTYEVAASEPGYESARVTTQLKTSSQDLVLRLRSPKSRPIDPRNYTISLREMRIPGKARSAYEKGLKRLEKHDPAGSLAHFNKAVAVYPGYYEAYLQMGLANMFLGNDEQAMASLQTAIDLTEGHFAAADIAMGWLLCRRNEYADAERVLRRGLELDGDSIEGHLGLAIALLNLNRLNEAEKSARAALLRDPNQPAAYALLSNVHALRHNYSAQVLDLEICLKLDPNGPLEDRIRQVREIALMKASKNAP